MRHVGEGGFVLEGGIALAPPVLTGFKREVEVLELVLVLFVHAPQDVWNPTRTTLPEHELHARVALQRTREDDTRQELGPGELEQGESGRAPLGGVLLGHLLVRGLTHGVAGGVGRKWGRCTPGPQPTGGPRRDAR